MGRVRIVGAAGPVLLAGSGFATGALPIDPPFVVLMLAAWWWMRDRADLLTLAL